MIASIFKNYKKNLLSVIFLIVGYSIGILCLSVGLSIVKEMIEYNLDSTSGNTDNMIFADIYVKNSDIKSYEKIEQVVNKISESAEVQLLNFVKYNIDDYETTIVPFCSKEQPSWHVPMLHGRYFNKSDENIKNIVIGKELMKKVLKDNFNEKSSVTLDGIKYNVLGVAGRKNRNTQWDDTIYVDFNFLPSSIKSNYANQLRNNSDDDYACISLLIREYRYSNMNPQEIVERECSAIFNDCNLEFEEVEGRDTSSITNSIIGTVFISGMILIIVVINVVNLSVFWILNRKKEISIKKLMGQTDKNLIVSIMLEVIIIAVTSVLIAIILQQCVAKIFYSYFVTNEISIEISKLNFIVSTIIAIICGLFSSILPIKEMLKLEPIEALRIE